METCLGCVKPSVYAVIRALTINQRRSSRKADAILADAEHSWKSLHMSNQLIEQFIYDLDDWLARQGNNIFCSRKLVEHCEPVHFGLWAAWLAKNRQADGLPLHVALPENVA